MGRNERAGRCIRLATIAAVWLAACSSPQRADSVEVEVSASPVSSSTPTAQVATKRQPDPSDLLDRCILDVRLELASDRTQLEARLPYERALRMELAGDLDGARRLYLSVIVDHKEETDLVAASYFAFGELFFRDGKADKTKLELAKQSYQEALKYKRPPASALGVLAHLRLADVENERGSADEAIFNYKNFIEQAIKHDFACEGPGLARATQQIGTVFAGWGDPKRAVDFLRMFGAEIGNSALVALLSEYKRIGATADAKAMLSSLLKSKWTPTESLCSRGVALARAIGDIASAMELENRCDNR